MQDSITYNFSREMYLDLLKTQMRKRYGWGLIVTALFFALIVIVSIYTYSKTGSYALLKAWIPFFICLGLWNAYIFLWLPRQVAFNKLNEKALQETTITIMEDYLEFSLKSGLLERIPYTHFVQSEITKNYASFWKNYMDLIVVPASAFETDLDYHNFTKKILANVQT